MIFILILHQKTIQGNSGFPSPQCTDLIYTLISTTSSHPPWHFVSPGIFKLDFFFKKKNWNDRRSSHRPVCSLICLLVSSCLLIIRSPVDCRELDHDCAFRSGVPSPLQEDSCERLKNTEFSSGSVGHIHCLGIKSASSCVRRGGPTWRRPGRTSGTGRGGALCACGSA